MPPLQIISRFILLPILHIPPFLQTLVFYVTIKRKRKKDIFTLLPIVVWFSASNCQGTEI